MGLFQMAKDYINDQYAGEEIRSQLESNWRGPFPLPEKLLEYYRHFGPYDLELGGCNGPFYLPNLADLWQYQAGFGYDPRTGIMLDGWDGDWLAIGDDGYRPFIFSMLNENILFDPYSDRQHRPVELFGSIEEMLHVLCVISGIAYEAGDDLLDDGRNVKSKYKEEVFLRVVETTGCLEKSKYLLILLSWY